jgi:hypothetical protein
MNKNVLFPLFLVVILIACVRSSHTNTETSTTVPVTANRLDIVFLTTFFEVKNLSPFKGI